MRVNLFEMANDLTRYEGGKLQLGTPQMLDVVAAQGTRWRKLSWWRFFCEARAIRNRAGTTSAPGDWMY